MKHLLGLIGLFLVPILWAFKQLDEALAGLKARIAFAFWRLSKNSTRLFGTFRLPFQLRQVLLGTAMELMPIGGGEGINGARVILYVNVSDSAGEEWTIVGGQAGLNFADTTAEIDVSDKLSGRLGERLPGRATASVSLDLNFLTTDPAQAFIKQAYRNRELVVVQRFYRNTADSDEGEAIEEASGVIVDLSESHPDQDKSTVSLQISLSNDWEPSA